VLAVRSNGVIPWVEVGRPDLKVEVMHRVGLDEVISDQFLGFPAFWQ